MLRPALLVALALAGFPGHLLPARAATVSPKVFCDAFETAETSAQFGSCSDKEERDPKVRAALDKSGRARQQCRELLGFSTSNKRVGIERTLADKCLSARRAAARDPHRSRAVADAMRTACDAAIAGLRKSGESCDSAFECGKGLACLGPKGGPPGTCAAPLAIGAACDDDALNASVLHATVLETRGPCGRGAHCGPKAGGALACVKDLAEGAACTRADPRACGPGLACVTGRCAAALLAAKGEACGAERSCSIGLGCVRGACVKRSVEGARCGDDEQCLGRCVKGRCAAFCGSG